MVHGTSKRFRKPCHASLARLEIAAACWSQSGCLHRSVRGIETVDKVRLFIRREIHVLSTCTDARGQVAWAEWVALKAASNVIPAWLTYHIKAKRHEKMQLRALWSNSLVDVTSSAAQFINDVLVYNDTYFQYVLIFFGVTRVCGALRTAAVHTTSMQVSDI